MTGAEHPAFAHLRAAHTRAEEIARAAMEPAVFLYPAQPVEFLLAGQEVITAETRAAEAHIRLHMPEAVLVRVEAERVILADHDPVDRRCCGDAGEAGDAGRTAVGWPCPTVVGLARAWGWKSRPDALG